MLPLISSSPAAGHGARWLGVTSNVLRTILTFPNRGMAWILHPGRSEYRDRSVYVRHLEAQIRLEKRLWRTNQRISLTSTTRHHLDMSGSDGGIASFMDFVLRTLLRDY
jgi:hypothetical protein